MIVILPLTSIKSTNQRAQNYKKISLSSDWTFIALNDESALQMPLYTLILSRSLFHLGFYAIAKSSSGKGVLCCKIEGFELIVSLGNSTGTRPMVGQGRRPTHTNRFGTDSHHGQLAVNQLKSFFFALFKTMFQNRVIFEFDRFIALNADHMVMVMGIGLIEFVVFMPFSQL
jgi:hypothetical protein